MGLGLGSYVVLDRERVSVQGTVLASLRRECVQQSQVNPLLYMYSSWMGCLAAHGMRVQLSTLRAHPLDGELLRSV